MIVADRTNHRVQIFDDEVKFMGKLGKEGKENGLFSYPRGVAVDSLDNIYVADGWNHRFQVFNADSTIHLRTMGTYGNGDGQFKYPWGICIDQENGNILVADAGNDRIQILECHPICLLGCAG